MVRKTRRKSRRTKKTARIGGGRRGGGLGAVFLLLGAVLLAIGLISPSYAHSTMAMFASTLDPNRVMVEVPGADHIQALCSDGKRYEGWGGAVSVPRYSYCYIQPYGHAPFKVSTYVDERKITVHSEPRPTPATESPRPFGTVISGTEYPINRPSGGSCNLRIVVWDETLRRDVSGIVPIKVERKDERSCQVTVKYPGLYNQLWGQIIGFEVTDVRFKGLPTRQKILEEWVEEGGKLDLVVKWVNLYYVIYLTDTKAYLYPPGKIVSFRVKGSANPPTGYSSEIWVGDLHGYHPATMPGHRFFVNWDSGKYPPYDGVIFPYGRPQGACTTHGDVRWFFEFPPGTSATIKIKLKGVRYGVGKTTKTITETKTTVVPTTVTKTVRTTTVVHNTLTTTVTKTKTSVIHRTVTKTEVKKVTVTGKDVPGSYLLLDAPSDPWWIKERMKGHKVEIGPHPKLGLTDPEGYETAVRKLEYFRWLNETDPEKFKEITGPNYEVWKYLISLPNETATGILWWRSALNQAEYGYSYNPERAPTPSPPAEDKTYEELAREAGRKALSESLKQNVQARGGKVYEDFDGDNVVEKAVVPERDPVTNETVDVYIPPEGQASTQEVDEPMLPERVGRPSPLNLFTILGALLTSLGILGMAAKW